MATRRRGGASTMSQQGAGLPPCLGHSNTLLGRFSSNTRRVWPPTHRQVAHQSLGFAVLVNGTRFLTAGRDKFFSMKFTKKGSGGGKARGKGDDGDDAVTKLIDKYGDGIGQVGFGGVVGFCSGYAMIKVGKSVAIVIGVGFIVAQGLNHSGVVSIKWNRVEKKAKKFLDANKDNKLDKEDAKAIWKRLKVMLTKNLPAGGGFASGFALGLLCG